MKHTKMMSESINRFSIPDEIVQYTILPMLSSKSLLRFTCVCKSWNSLIRHPSFLHLRRPTNLTHRFIFISHIPRVLNSEFRVFSSPYQAATANTTTTTTTPRATLLFTLPNPCFFDVYVQCVNGFLCFHPSSTTCLSSPVSAFTLIANPTTRQILTLPIDHSINYQCFKMSTHFGYDPVRDQFKVLRLIEYHNSLEFKVFTLGTRDSSWRLISPPPAKSYFMFSSRGLYVNGAIHWKYKNWEIVSFDVATESISFIPVPKTYRNMQIDFGSPPFPDLVEIRGCLSLIAYSDGGFKLWMLKDYHNQVWELNTILLPSQIEPVGKEEIGFPLCEVPSGEILLLQYFVPLANDVRGIYYDMETMSARKVELVEMPQRLWPNYILDRLKAPILKHLFILSSNWDMPG